jgi:hypothetical protein
LVVDGAGHPVKGALVSIRTLVPGGDPGDARSWIFELGGRRTTGKEGRFAIPGVFPPQIRIDIRHSEFDSRIDRVVPAGSVERRYVLHLHRGGLVAGSFLLPDRVRTEELFLAAYPEGKGRTGGAGVSPGGGFLIKGMPPGTYRIVLRARNNLRPLVEVPGVEVRAGTPARDPRLQGVDLRDRLGRLRLRVLDGRGKRIHRLWLTPLDGSGAGAGREGHAPLLRGVDREGRVGMTCLREGGPFLLGAPGFRCRRVSWREGEQTLTLAPGLLVALQIAVQPAGEFMIRLEPLPAGLHPGRRRVLGWSCPGSYARSSIEAGGTYRVTLPGPGPYRVLWEACFPMGGDGDFHPVPQVRPTTIRVEESPMEQFFSIALSPQDLARARRQAEGR